MIKTWIAALNDLGIAVFDAFLLPGNIALSQVSAYAPEIAYRFRSLKARIVYRLRQLVPAEEPGIAVSMPENDFDDLDLTVLRTGATPPPGLLLSASELAGQLTKRPAQVQRSLDKLRKYKLVDNVIGKTDGFDNYRLTESGVHLAASWLREAKLS